jgi:hypothetical protein
MEEEEGGRLFNQFPYLLTNMLGVKGRINGACNNASLILFIQGMLYLGPPTLREVVSSQILQLDESLL